MQGEPPEERLRILYKMTIGDIIHYTAQCHLCKCPYDKCILGHWAKKIGLSWRAAGAHRQTVGGLHPAVVLASRPHWWEAQSGLARDPDPPACLIAFCSHCKPPLWRRATQKGRVVKRISKWLTWSRWHCIPQLGSVCGTHLPWDVQGCAPRGSSHSCGTLVFSALSCLQPFDRGLS